MESQGRYVIWRYSLQSPAKSGDAARRIEMHGPATLHRQKLTGKRRIYSEASLHEATVEALTQVVSVRGLVLAGSHSHECGYLPAWRLRG